MANVKGIFIRGNRTRDVGLLQRKETECSKIPRPFMQKSPGALGTAVIEVQIYG